MQKQRAWIALTIAGSWSLCLAPWSLAGTFVPMPCTVDRTQTRSGGSIADLKGLRPCNEISPQSTQLLRRAVGDTIKRHRTNKPDRPSGPSLSWPSRMSIPRPADTVLPACSLQPLGSSLSATTPEGDGLGSNTYANKNIANQDCGNFCRIDLSQKTSIVDVSSSPVPQAKTLSGEVRQNQGLFVAPLPSPSPSPSPRYVEIPLENIYTAQADILSPPVGGLFSGPYCGREDSFIRGAFLQVLECKGRAVADEVAKGLGVQVSSASPSQVGECQGLADDIMRTVNGIQQGAQSLMKELGSRAALLAAVGRCSDTKIDPKKQTPSIGPCILESARESLQGAFTHLAACEVYVRSKRAFEKHMALGAPLLDQIRKDVLNTCTQQCRPPQRGNLQSNRLTLDQVEKELEDCANQCYQREVVPRLKSELQKLFPLGTGGCPNA